MNKETDGILKGAMTFQVVTMLISNQVFWLCKHCLLDRMAQARFAELEPDFSSCLSFAAPSWILDWSREVASCIMIPNINTVLYTAYTFFHNKF